MARGSAQHPGAVSPATFALFCISAIVVGGIGSARLWEAHIGGPPMPLERMLPLVVVAELLAYFAIMLARSHVPTGALQVAAGVLVALATRGGQAALAALVGSPAQAEQFRGALAHYYAGYFPGVLLQIGVACLFLWLVKAAFEGRPPVLVPQAADDEPAPSPEAEAEAEVEAEAETPAEDEPAERRRELIEQLMRSEDPGEHEEAPAPEAAQPAAPEDAPDPEQPRAPAVTGEAAAEAGPPEQEPEQEPEEEQAPEHSEEVPAAPPEQERPERPERRDATAAPRPQPPGTPSLSARESVIKALLEDDEQEEQEEVLRLPLEGPPAAPAPAPAQPPAGTDEPEAAPSPALAAPPPSALDALSAVTQDAGAGGVLVERSEAGRLLILAAPAMTDAAGMAAACEAYLGAASCLCEHCGTGGLRRTYLRSAGGYVAGTAVMAGDHGAWAMVALPPEANLGSADVVLGRLEAPAGALELPAWPPPTPPDLMPAYPDRDLEARIGPLFEWVPQAAGLTLTVGCAGGLQVAMLTSGGPPSETTAAAVARVHTDAEQLCAACGLPDCGMGLVAGDGGAAAWASADVAGQRLLLCLLRPGAGAPGPVSIQLRQIISGLGEVAGAGAGGAE